MRTTLLAIALTSLSACAVPFSEMQSARLAGVGRSEITPTYSMVRAPLEEGGTGSVQTQFGAQAAYGLTKNLDLRLRYERIALSELVDEEGSGSGTNILAIGPKFPLVRDRIALFVPIGLGFGGGIKSSETVQVHPTVLLTLPVGKAIDINSSLKALIPLSDKGGETLVAVNLGLGISTADRKWTVRPEVGVLRKPNESGHFRHFSIGLTRGFGR